MGKVRFDISMSVDGFIAGPNMRPEAGLGDDGERLHEWAVGTKTFREAHGESGGIEGSDADVMAEMFEATGAIVMGRRMFGGEGAWDNPAWGDGAWEGWWGEEPPFKRPVFVLTHHPREQLVKGATTFSFVTDGIESAVAQARDAAGDDDVAIGGGADVIQQALRAGLVDEFQLHVAPVLLRRGVRLFDEGDRVQGLELVRTIASPAATHLKYRVVR